MQLLTIHHCLWSQLSKCLLNVTQVFKQAASVCCVGMCCVQCDVLDCVKCTCREHRCRRSVRVQVWLRACVRVWLRAGVRVHVWLRVCGCGRACGCVVAGVRVCLSLSLIQKGINPIHYLAELRAAQSMALSVAADELPFLTRCIIQTCRRAKICLAFQSTKETWKPTAKQTVSVI